MSEQDNPFGCGVYGVETWYFDAVEWALVVALGHQWLGGADECVATDVPARAALAGREREEATGG